MGLDTRSLSLSLLPPGLQAHAQALGCANGWGGASGDGEQRFLGRTFFGLRRDCAVKPRQ